MFFKNTASQTVFAQMNSRVDGSPLTSAVSIATSIDAGADGAGGGTLTHLANGSWRYVPTQAETNGEMIRFQFTHATGVDVTLSVPTGGVMSAAGALALWQLANGIETGKTPQEAMRIILASTGCKSDGGGTTTMHFRDPADSKNRITATVDANGNRSAVTFDVT